MRSSNRKALTTVGAALLLVALVLVTTTQIKASPDERAQQALIPLPMPADSEPLPGQDSLTTSLAQAEFEFLMTRDPATNTVPTDRLWTVTGTAHKTRGTRSQRLPSAPFIERGPSNIGGRTRAVVWDPDVPRKAWAGSVSGGLWYTADATLDGTPWVKVDDFWDNLAVTALAYDPTTSGSGRVWYAGTGEGFFNADSLRGGGIFKSTDGGATWSLLSSTAGNSTFHYVQKIVVTSAGTVLAATNEGVQYSFDGGASWIKVLGSSGAISPSLNDFAGDLEIAANGDIYASMGRVISPCDGVYKSTAAQNGFVWSKRTLPGPCDYERIEIAVAPSDAGRVYAATQSTLDLRVNHVFRSDDFGATWFEIGVPSGGVFDAWFSLNMSVDPNNSDVVWLGAIQVSRSTNGGVTWNGLPPQNLLFYGHHAIAFRPGSSDEILMGTSGGVFYTSNATAGSPGLINRNDSYNVTQYNGGDSRPYAGSPVLIGGSQGLGTHVFDSPGIDLIDSPLPLGVSTGGLAYIDQSYPDFVIASRQNGDYFRSFNGGASYSNFFFSVSTSFAVAGDPLFINPGDYDGNGDNDILYGHFSEAEIFVCTNLRLGPIDCFTSAFTGPGSIHSAFTVSPYTTPALSTVFIGTTNGKFFKFRYSISDGTVSYQDSFNLTWPFFPDGSISSIAVGRSENELLVTFSNYGVDSVWQSMDGGLNWIDRDDNSSLPDIPVRTALFDPEDPNRVLIGTDAGLWGTNNLSGAAANAQEAGQRLVPTWERDPTVPLTRINQLKYRPADGQILAVTYGRGMWTGEFQRTNLVVDTATDTALRAAIAGTSPGGTVTFNPVLSGSTIDLTQGEIVLDKNVTIDASALAEPVTLNGALNGGRFFQIPSGNNVDIYGLSLIQASGSTDGGAIYNAGVLTLRDIDLSGNSATTRGGAIFNLFGDLTLQNVTLRNNSVTGSGGVGGAVYVNGGAFRMVNSTVHANSAPFYAGIANANADATVIHSTIVGNGTPLTFQGGGLAQLNFGIATLLLENSIVAGNTAASGADIFNMNDGIEVAGDNLIGNNDTAEARFPAGPLVGTAGAVLNPLLGPLADNGGRTPTLLPQIGSPAVDAAGNTANSPLADQRGVARPFGPDNDLGSVELTIPPPNDAFVNALDVSGGGLSLGTLLGATRDGSSSADSTAFPNEPDVWYRFVADANGTLRVNTCGSIVLSNINTVLSLHTDTGVAGTVANELIANDRWNNGGDPAANCSSGFDSAVALAVGFGDTVLIRVSQGDTFGGLDFNLNVALTDVDTDGDGIADGADNCTLVSNADQRDTDGDGYGNLCDADLDNNGIVNAVDLGLFRSVFFTPGDLDADFNGDNIVNAIDLGIFRASFFMPPGPSGLAP